MSTRRADPLLYLRTARDLGPGQILARPVRPLLRALLPILIRRLRISPDGEIASQAAASLRRLAPAVRELVAEEESARHTAIAEEVSRGTFRFLSQSEQLGVPDWNTRHLSRLWRYHLHYFGYAESLARAFKATGRSNFLRALERLVGDWIARASAFRGDGWDPYPTSLRLDHWIRSLALVCDDISPDFRARWLESIDLQARYLARSLETHLHGNHLIKNYKALTIAGLVLPGKRGQGLLGLGIRGLQRQAQRQVLADGVHYERAPMYHAIVLEDLLHAITYLGTAGVGDTVLLRAGAERMAESARVFERPDGTWHQFGDSASGHAPSPRELGRLAERTLERDFETPAGVLSLAAAGFSGWAADGGRTKFLIRCGPHGPAEQPGHAHCDLLSFELCIDGVPIVVDTGVRDYENDDTRHYVRSTGAHSTVRLGLLEQSEIWSAFRVGRRATAAAHPYSLHEPGKYGFRGECCHYHSRATHSRVVEGSAEGWSVIDRIGGSWLDSITSAVHLHPGLRLVRSDEGEFEFAAGDRVVRLSAFGFDRVTPVRGGDGPVRGVWYPAFGVERERTSLEMTIYRNDGREFGFRVCVTEADGAGGE